MNIENLFPVTYKEAIKEIEISGKQIPFNYGVIWLEEGDEIDSEQRFYYEKHEYYCFEFESTENNIELINALRNRYSLPIKVTTASNKVIECNFICTSYSGGYDQINEYELQQSK